MAVFDYFLGGDSGGVYRYSSTAVADDTTAITCQYITARTDLGYPDHWKHIHNIRLVYIDKGAVSVAVSLSTSEGDTVVADWKTVTHTIGTAGAPGTIKSKNYGFVETGYLFNFKIYNSAASGNFEFVKLQIEFEVGSPYFELST